MFWYPLFQPPTFPDLPKRISISESKIGALYTFSVDDPSYGPDTITCQYERAIPNSESHKFYIVGRCDIMSNYNIISIVFHGNIQIGLFPTENIVQ